MGMIRIAVAMATMIAPVTACGGDDEAAGTTPSTSTPAPASTVTAPPQVTVDPAEVELVAWCIANAPVSIDGPTEEVEREMAEELARQGADVDPPAEIRDAVEIFRLNAGP